MRVTWFGFPGSGEYAEDNARPMGLEINPVQKLLALGVWRTYYNYAAPGKARAIPAHIIFRETTGILTRWPLAGVLLE